MGDMMSLIEKAQEDFDDEKAAELERKIKKNEFTLEDFLEQMGQVRNMGGIGKILDMMPGANKAAKDVDLDESEKEFAQMEAIILSMTRKERKDPSLLNASRRKRIAAGSGQPVSKINTLIKRYEEARKMMKQLSGFGSKNNKKMKRNKMFRGF